MPKHSKTPWSRGTAPYGGVRVGPAILPHPGRDSRYLAELIAQREADAALIAAAPDLLAALKALVADVRSIEGYWTEGTDDLIRVAEAAIVKAEG